MSMSVPIFRYEGRKAIGATTVVRRYSGKPLQLYATAAGRLRRRPVGPPSSRSSGSCQKKLQVPEKLLKSAAKAAVGPRPQAAPPKPVPKDFIKETKDRLVFDAGHLVPSTYLASQWLTDADKHRRCIHQLDVHRAFAQQADPAAVKPKRQQPAVPCSASRPSGSQTSATAASCQRLRPQP